MMVVLLSGWLNNAWFTRSIDMEQTYEGLSYKNRDTKDQLSGATAFLQENGYKIGYASYWNANVVTEVTDGTVHMIGVTIYTDPEGCIKYYDFLTSLWLREVPNEKPFLLIDHYEALPENMVPYCVQVYADACYSVYDITDLETFRELLNS